MRDFEQPYDSFGSRFSAGAAAAQRGSFGRFMGTGQGVGRFAGQMVSSFQPPQGSNQQEQDAFASQLEQTNMAQFGDGLGRLQNQYGQVSQIGLSGVSDIQAVQQAREMASLRKQSANQGALFNAIGTGLSLASGIKSWSNRRSASGIKSRSNRRSG